MKMALQLKSLVPFNFEHDWTFTEQNARSSAQAKVVGLVAWYPRVNTVRGVRPWQLRKH